MKPAAANDDAPLGSSLQFRIAGGLSAPEARLLIFALRKPVDFDELPLMGVELTPYTMAFLMHWRLIRTFIDESERIYVTTTKRGAAVLATLAMLKEPPIGIRT